MTCTCACAERANELQRRLDAAAADLGRFTQSTVTKTKALEYRAMVAERRVADLEGVIAGGLVAVQLTREYVGEDVLPARPGWSHHDWTNRAEAALREGT